MLWTTFCNLIITVVLVIATLQHNHVTFVKDSEELDQKVGFRGKTAADIFNPRCVLLKASMVTDILKSETTCKVYKVKIETDPGEKKNKQELGYTLARTEHY